jgi:hypothetical protein
LGSIESFRLAAKMARESTKPGHQRVGGGESGSKGGERGGQLEIKSHENGRQTDKTIELRFRRPKVIGPWDGKEALGANRNRR